jgi:leucyl/phenylalanyl-tRNA--protein transferase
VEWGPINQVEQPMHGGARVEITPELLLRAYAAGIFPMAEDADDPTLFWVEPRERGVIPLDNFHVARRLARTVRSDAFEIRVDHDFDAVIAGCASPASTAAGPGSADAFGASMASSSTADTVTRSRRTGRGGSRGGSTACASEQRFFGESMFHRERDASKVALVHLAARLRAGGFRLLDAQFVTDHLTQFGAMEMPQRGYKRLLRDAVDSHAEWYAWPPERRVSGSEALTALA